MVIKAETPQNDSVPGSKLMAMGLTQYLCAISLNGVAPSLS